MSAPHFAVIRWKDLERWIVPRIVFRTEDLPVGWTLARLGDNSLVRQIQERVRVEDDTEYRMVGVRWYGEGAFHRETNAGKDLSAAYVTPVIPGAFIYNRLFAWKESFAVVPPELDGCFVSSEFPQFLVDESRLLTRYLYLYFRCRSTLAAVDSSSVGSAAVSRNRFKEEEFLDFRIPLPPLPIQQAIVEHWQTAQAEIAARRERVESVEALLGERVLQSVGISLHPLVKKPKSTALNWKDFDRWGVEFNRWDWTLADLLASKDYEMRRLGDVAEINPISTIKPLNDAVPVSFIPMEAVSDKEGAVVQRNTARYYDVKSGYTRFQNGDMIWAKITPCMQNGKSAVMHGLENGIGFGSTEFHVVRPRLSEECSSEYLWVLLRLHHIRQAAQRYFIGSAGQQRVPAEFLENLQIPLPPLSGQRKIVAIVNAQRADISGERLWMDEKAADVKREVEEMIMGTRLAHDTASPTPNPPFREDSSTAGR